MQVSVIIPAYNHEKYITDAINSVLNQSYQDFELIIINDGSTDSTEEKILSIHDQRIKYISQKNSGAHSAINCGISWLRVNIFQFLILMISIYRSAWRRVWNF